MLIGAISGWLLWLFWFLIAAGVLRSLMVLGLALGRRPDDPDQSAHYAVLIDQEMYLRSCPYDVRPLFEAIDRCGITDQNKEVSLVFWGQR